MKKFFQGERGGGMVIGMAWGLAATLGLALPIAAQAQFVFMTNNGSITVNGYMGTDSVVSIPGTVNGLPVTRIQQNAIYLLNSLTSLTIPDSVTRIESAASAGCISLTNVTIGSGMTNIVYKMGNGGPNQRSITVGAANPVYSSAEGVLFNKNKTTLIEYPTGKTGSYVIPGSVTSVSESAFSYCRSLTSITIPGSVAKIRTNAFYGCNSLASVTMGIGISAIEQGAFQSCLNLTSIMIPDTVTNIGSQAFSGITGLGSITIPDSVTSIGFNAFSGCTSLTNISIGGGLANIGSQAFSGITGLGNITIPDTVTNIGFNAFSGCTSLTNISIGGGLANIGSQAFSGITGLGNITIPGSVTAIGPNAFSGCTSLTDIYFLGNAPAAPSSPFDANSITTIYYLAGTTGWGATFGGRPTAVWNPEITSTTRFGVVSNQFGFDIQWANGKTVVVDVCTSLAISNWSPLATHTLAGSSSYFGDSRWTNQIGQFYRLRTP